MSDYEYAAGCVALERSDHDMWFPQASGEADWEYLRETHEYDRPTRSDAKRTPIKRETAAPERSRSAGDKGDDLLFSAVNHPDELKNNKEQMRKIRGHVMHTYLEKEAQNAGSRQTTSIPPSKQVLHTLRKPEKMSVVEQSSSDDDSACAGHSSREHSYDPALRHNDGDDGEEKRKPSPAGRQDRESIWIVAETNRKVLESWRRGRFSLKACMNEAGFRFCRLLQTVSRLPTLEDVRRCRRYLRPSIREGCRRIEWTCSCGKAMYGDYAQEEVLESSMLFRNLPECRILPPSSGLGSRFFSRIFVMSIILQIARLWWTTASKNTWQHPDTFDPRHGYPDDTIWWNFELQRFEKLGTAELIASYASLGTSAMYQELGYFEMGWTAFLDAFKTFSCGIAAFIEATDTLYLDYVVLAIMLQVLVNTLGFGLVPFNIVGNGFSMFHRLSILSKTSFICCSGLVLFTQISQSLLGAFDPEIAGVMALMNCLAYFEIYFRLPDILRLPLSSTKSYKSQPGRTQATNEQSASTTTMTTHASLGNEYNGPAQSTASWSSSLGCADDSRPHLKPTTSLCDHAPLSSSERLPCFLELCVNRNKSRISLGEIQVRNAKGEQLVKGDQQLFAEIRKKYSTLRRRGLYSLLYRPSDVHFVRFGVQRGGYQTGIYQSPLSIPPQIEVTEGRYHYYVCPLDALPPIDAGTFFHYFWNHDEHPERSGHPGFDSLFYNRLPKKLGTSMLLQTDPDKLHLGWGVHIIEGPNKPLLAWSVTAILVSSFVVSVLYDIVMKNKDSGFAIGQWMVATLCCALTAVCFHLGDTA